MKKFFSLSPALIRFFNPGLFAFVFLYDECLLRLFASASVFRSAQYPFLTALAAGFFCSFLLMLLRGRLRSAVRKILLFLSAVWFIVQTLLNRVYAVYFPVASIGTGAGGVAEQYTDMLIRTILLGIPVILLYLLPLILDIVRDVHVRRHPSVSPEMAETIIQDSASQQGRFSGFPVRQASALFMCAVILQAAAILTETHGRERDVYASSYTFDNATRIFGLLTSTRLDFKYMLAGNDESGSFDLDSDFSFADNAYSLNPSGSSAAWQDTSVPDQASLSSEAEAGAAGSSETPAGISILSVEEESVSVISESEESVSALSGAEESISAAFEADENASVISEAEEDVSGISGAEESISAASGAEENVSGISGAEEDVSGISGAEKKISALSGLEERISALSGPEIISDSEGSPAGSAAAPGPVVFADRKAAHMVSAGPVVFSDRKTAENTCEETVSESAEGTPETDSEDVEEPYADSENTEDSQSDSADTEDPQADSADAEDSQADSADAEDPQADSADAGPEAEEEPAPPEPNAMDLDFTALAAESGGAAQNISAYVSTLSPSMKNAYTGLFAGKNLILICAEAYNDSFVSRELTPTLWRMTHEGFYFSDFYQPAWGGSTSTGEFSMLFGLAPQNSSNTILQTQNSNNYFTMGNQLQRLGYSSWAFHNGTNTYYNRDKTHKNLGYDEWIAMGSGLEKMSGGKYPDDKEMFDVTMDLYIDRQPFSVYYMSVSGHAPYSNPNDSKVTSHIDRVKEILGDHYSEFSQNTINYICYQMVLEDALTLMIRRLEDAGIAEDTVIAMTGDHYPYGLRGSEWGNSGDNIENLYGHEDGTPWGLDKTGCIMWSECLETEYRNMAVEIDTPSYSLDMLPTLSNLFGLEYDSRLLVGRDVFSEQMPLVLWNNGSWITDRGRYNSRTGSYEAAEVYKNAELPPKSPAAAAEDSALSAPPSPAESVIARGPVVLRDTDARDDLFSGRPAELAALHRRPPVTPPPEKEPLTYGPEDEAEYTEWVRTVVKNKLAFSKQVIDNNYYETLFGKDEVGAK